MYSWKASYQTLHFLFILENHNVVYGQSKTPVCECNKYDLDVHFTEKKKKRHFEFSYRIHFTFWQSNEQTSTASWK